jgi:VWFA-related protein
LTRSVPGGYSLTDSFYQLAFVRLVAPQVAAALLGDSLCVTVSVRHPYAWLEAVLRFWNWPEAPHGDAWVASERAALAKRLCIRFNQRYASWLGFAATFGGRALVVRAEDLREQPEQVAARAGTTFGLHPRRNRIVGLRRNVLPSPWDHFPPCYERRRARTGPRRKSLSAPVAASGAAQGRPRYIALFFDDVATPVADLERARNGAEQYLRDGIGRRDRIAVFTASSTVSLGFTRNLAAIEAAVGRLHTHPRTSRNGAEAKVCHGGMGGFEVHEIRALADASWTLERGNSYDLLKAVDDVVAFLRQQPGRRILVLTSGGFISGELNMLKGDMVRRALRANVTINALDARGLFTQDASRPLNDASDYAGPLPLLTWEFEQTSRLDQELANEDAMRQLSHGTGGAFFHNNNDLALGFRRLSRLLKIGAAGLAAVP